MPTDPNSWSQFGLSGLIILAFLCGWAYLGKYFIDKWKRSDDEKQTVLMTTMQEAKGDREKFTITIEKINDRMLATLGENTKVIQDFSQETRKVLTALGENTKAVQDLRAEMVKKVHE